MTLCLGVLKKREALYLRSVCKDSPQCNVYLAFRGRGSRKKHGNSQDLPVKYAEKVAVYIKSKEEIKRNKGMYTNTIIERS